MDVILSRNLSIMVNWKIFGLFILGLVSCKKDLASLKVYDTWSAHGGSKEGIRYSSLNQIDTSNAKNLVVAWDYRSGDADTAGQSQIQCNPIIIDSVLYATTARLKVVALHAATGQELWVFDPFDSLVAGVLTFQINNSRGLAYWSDGAQDRRLFYTVGSFLMCVDAERGTLIKTFGIDGMVDLHTGLDRDIPDLYISSSTPGIIYNNLIIMGTRMDEGPYAAPGHIRAYDVISGARQWIFHTIPHPGEFGFDTWEDSLAYRHIGAANSWCGFTLDEARGIVYVPLGSAAFDFYGGKRLGNNLFANCLVALDAATGERKWHFQTIHHDVWDKDLPTAPALVTIKKGGKSIDAVAQPTKNGFLFVLDRVTGEPLFPVHEKSVPTDTDLEGEKLAPTQPVPEENMIFSRQTFTAAEINDLVPDSSQEDILKRLNAYRHGHVFNPPSKQGTVIFPGFDGGAEWGGPAYDPTTGIFYVNTNEMPWVLTMVEAPHKPPVNENKLQAGQRLYRRNCMACHGSALQGGGNIPTLKEVNKKYTEQTFTELITTGRRMMPGFKQLHAQEIDAIAVFVLNQPKEAKKPFIAPERAPDPYLNLPYSITGYNKFLTKEGYPAINPPWGTLNAIDLNAGKLLWKIPFGETPEFKAKGIITGTENYGGPAVTSGGVLFIGATKDEKFRVFNKMSGEVIWEYQLPAAGYATPSVYQVNGKQYVVIACGGGKLGTKSGDSFVAFSLP